MESQPCARDGWNGNSGAREEESKGRGVKAMPQLPQTPLTLGKGELEDGGPRNWKGPSDSKAVRSDGTRGAHQIGRPFDFGIVTSIDVTSRATGTIHPW